MTRMHRQEYAAPSDFRGDIRLKFTHAEQAAIRDAERTLGYEAVPQIRSQPPRRRNLLGMAIAIIIALLFFDALIAIVPRVQPQPAPTAEAAVNDTAPTALPATDPEPPANLTSNKPGETDQVTGPADALPETASAGRVIFVNR